MGSSVYLSHPRSAGSFCRYTITFNGFRECLSRFPTCALRRAVPSFRGAPGHCRSFLITIGRSGYNHTTRIVSRVGFVGRHTRFCDILVSDGGRNILPLHMDRGSAGSGGIVLSTGARGTLYIVSLSAVVPKFSIASFNSTVHFNTDATTRSRGSLSGMDVSVSVFTVCAGNFLRNYNRRLLSARVVLLPRNTGVVAIRYNVHFLTSCLRNSICFGASCSTRGLSHYHARLGLITSVRDG